MKILAIDLGKFIDPCQLCKQSATVFGPDFAILPLFTWLRRVK